MQGTRRSFLKWTVGAGFLAFAGGIVTYFKKRNPWLHGGFKPVSNEISSENLTIRGAIPKGLEGTYIRNGGNPVQPCAKYGIYDGDGMLHAVKIEEGTASYRNRFVRTQSLEEEKASGKSLFNCDADGLPYANRAGLSVIKHHGRLLALSIGTPHEVNEKNLSTVGLYDFEGQWKLGVQPRPKIDPETKEMFILGRDSEGGRFAAVNSEGKVKPFTPVKLKPYQVLSDFAITKNYLLAILPSARFKDNKKQIDETITAELVAIPRDKGQTKSWMLGAHWLSSAFNAFEENGYIIMRGIANQTTEMHGSILEWQFNLKEHKTSIENIDSSHLLWPAINPAYVGRKNRFGFCGELAGRYTVSKIFKFDFETREKKSFALGDHCYGGDFKFVADPKRLSNEDGGWLVGFVYNELWWRSHLEIIDAATMTSVAQIEIPQRVPYGLVGTWIPKEQSNN